MTHSEIAKQYCLDIVDGKIPASKYIRLACQKHLDDLVKSEDGTKRWFFDESKANRACKFVELMYHTKGKWAREKKRLKLEPWQTFFICSIFGWVDRLTGLRKHRQAVLLVPRKNGKSQLAAAIGLYMLAADGEEGAEVYSGATTQKQALEVFTPAKIMCQKNEQFCEHFGVEARASAIIKPSDLSKFEPLIGNPGDGSSPHLAIIDEYHEHESDRQVETMITGMGAREQPLLLVITTAGSNIGGPCYQMQLDCQAYLDGVKQDDRVFALIYSIDPDDDWTVLENVIKANPNYGVSVSAEFLETQLLQAKQTPRRQSAFQTKHCNVWVGARDAFFNVQKFQSLADSTLKIEDFAGCRAYIGLDLASKKDVASMAVRIVRDNLPDVFFVYHFLPEETVYENDMYTAWANAGHIKITDGAIIDQDFIKAHLIGDDEGGIIGLCELLDVKEIALDPHDATKITTELLTEGAPVVHVPQNMVNLSEPMKQLDAEILDGKIRHTGCPVMTWMISNVTTKENYRGQVYPRKEREENKIDGVVALIMATGRAMTHEDDASLDDWLNNMVSVNG